MKRRVMADRPLILALQRGPRRPAALWHSNANATRKHTPGLSAPSLVWQLNVFVKCIKWNFCTEGFYIIHEARCISKLMKMHSLQGVTCDSLLRKGSACHQWKSESIISMLLSGPGGLCVKHKDPLSLIPGPSLPGSLTLWTCCWTQGLLSGHMFNTSRQLCFQVTAITDTSVMDILFCVSIYRVDLFHLF